MTDSEISLRTEGLSAWFGDHHVVKSISLSVSRNDVYALIGPSGCGKSTFIRCLNRLHEEIDGARVQGDVWLSGDSGPENIYAPGSDPVAIRRQVGMVFQKPNPFPGLSIFDNVVAGLSPRAGRWTPTLRCARVSSSTRRRESHARNLLSFQWDRRATFGASQVRQRTRLRVQLTFDCACPRRTLTCQAPICLEVIRTNQLKSSPFYLKK